MGSRDTPTTRTPHFLPLLLLSFILLLPLAFAVPTKVDRHREELSGRCCERLDTLEPIKEYVSEGGKSEVWDENDEQLECAGVAVVRYTVKPKGLILPSYSNSPRLVYIVQGTGLGSFSVPGCPETFHTQRQRESSEGTERKSQRYERERTQDDEYQSVNRYNQGDIVALPAGVTGWLYNDGDRPFVSVLITHMGNQANQLDDRHRVFFLAGSRSMEQELQGKDRRSSSVHREYQLGTNIFDGFDPNLLSESYDISLETARKLQIKEEKDQRGHIILVKEGLHLEEIEEEDEEHKRNDNGVDETLCSMRMKVNIGNPQYADVYSSRGGHITEASSSKLPILQSLDLSAMKGRLKRNTILAPHWNINAHRVIYVIRGEAHAQVVDDSGRSVYDGRLREGQVLVVPQNFVLVKKASEGGDYEWVSFNTRDHALISPLVGKSSVFRGFPEEVVANSYCLSSEEAKRIKYGREDEFLLFPPLSV